MAASRGGTSNVALHELEDAITSYHSHDIYLLIKAFDYHNEHGPCKNLYRL
jgi:hypothetical protein